MACGFFRALFFGAAGSLPALAQRVASREWAALFSHLGASNPITWRAKLSGERDVADSIAHSQLMNSCAHDEDMLSSSAAQALQSPDVCRS